MTAHKKNENRQVRKSFFANKPAVFGLLVIVISMIVALLGFLILPDNPPKKTVDITTEEGMLMFLSALPSDRDLSVRFPPKNEEVEAKPKERNVFDVLLNFDNQLRVEERPMKLKNLKVAVKEFIMNNGRDERSSESPEKAVVSLKTDRGTDYDVYISVMDEIKDAYNELRAEQMGITLEAYHAILNSKKKRQANAKLDAAIKAIPYGLFEHEPTSVN